jgi:hypothetical protein
MQAWLAAACLAFAFCGRSGQTVEFTLPPTGRFGYLYARF